ncbi:hypothetical protein [Moorena sp. SIO3A2]|uniref:hypothetical protein n=1 Tax=Moorena sp. SIO3A2 TaxID=2607841 RepID=UPI0013BA12FB|nr:hypothetical protein [Moorena sp. SIO3A2]NER91516.1 hypothetical protein [Moorena sp. SIO3A2]
MTTGNGLACNITVLAILLNIAIASIGVIAMGASPKSCLTRWCVTGSNLTVATEKIRAPLTHPTQHLARSH